MAFRERAYPTSGQHERMVRHCADARFVWNLALEHLNYWRPGMKWPSAYDQEHLLAEARQGTWLGGGSSVVQQQALFDLHRGFKNWWMNPGHFGRPKWRKAGRNEGFAIRDNKIRRINKRWCEVLVPKCGWVRFRRTRSFADIAACKSARVTLDRAGRWHVSFVAPQPEFVREPTGASIGVDMGVAHTATTSDGEHFDMGPLLTDSERRRLRLLQRKLARQTKGSNRRKATVHKIAVLKTREADRRKDWIEKTTTALVRDNDLIAVEDLRIKNMTASAAGTIDTPGVNVAAKRGLNRVIINQAWGLFRQRLEQKAAAATNQSVVVAVNPANTSRTCNRCGHIDARNRKNQTGFLCIQCGHTANADVNAALNILAAGLAATGRGGTAQSRPPCETSTILTAA